MNQNKTDHEWQQLESRISKMVHQLLKNDLPAIEHKPRDLPLMPWSPENRNEETVDVL
jgi:hypothetical protein